MIDVDIPDQVVALRKYLHNETALVRMKAARGPGDDRRPPDAAAEIVTVLEQASITQGGYIARALGNVGDPASLPALTKAHRREPDAGARGEMEGAIRRLGGTVDKR